MILSIKGWRIKLDVNETKDYYQDLEILKPKDTEAFENFREYCEKMSDNEKNFFDKLGIIPWKCDVDSIGYENGCYPTSGRYLMKGSFLEMPEEYFMPVEEFLEKLPEIGEPADDEIRVGRFEIHFLRESGMFDPAPDDLPEGFICMEIWAEKLPWMLTGKPSHIMPQPARWWQLRKQIQEFRDAERFRQEMKKEAVAGIRKEMKRQHIAFLLMDRKKVRAFKRYWFRTFTPAENVKKARKVCFSRGNYLWHLFSFEYASCLEGNDAARKFQEKEKTDVYAYLHAHDIVIKMKSVGKFEWELFDLDSDTLIVDRKFRWTFVRTHEEECGLGPYFKEL